MKRTLFFLIWLMPIFLQAQQITGAVTSTTDEVLPGATVQVGKVATQTNLEGKFTLILKEKGRIQLSIFYTGYQGFTLDTVVSTEGIHLGNIKLQPSNNSLGEVIVVGSSAGSQLKALNIKKSANAIMEVLAADAIGKLPDRNAAEAVQRIQGVSIERDQGEGRYVSVRGTPIQWSASLLNGNRLPSASLDYADRRIQMDIFPSEMIQYVQLSKAITPDMEGDAIGGSINFITKTAPLKRTLNISAAGGYNGQSQRASYNGSLLFGDRVANGKLGYILSAVIWDRTAAQDRYNLNYDFGNSNAGQAFSITDLQLRDYIAHRRTIGFNGGLEYAFNERHKIIFKGLYSEYLDAQRVRENYFYFNTKTATITTRAADYHTNLYSGELSGQSNFSEKIGLDWSFSMDKSAFKFKDPDYYPMATFSQKVSYDGMAADGKKYLAMDSPDGEGDYIDKILPQLSSTTPISAEAMKLTQVVNIRSKNQESNKRAGINLKYTPSSSLTIKVGGKFIHKDKNVENPYSVYVAGVSGPAPTLAGLGTEPYPYRGGFLTEIGSPYSNVLIDQMSMESVRQLASPAGIADNKLYPFRVDSAENASGAANYYSGRENVYAIYGSAEYKLTDQLTVIAGIRNEYNKVTFSGSKVSTLGDKSPQVEAINQDNSYNAFLPMLHLKINATENDLIRLAFTRSFARPDFGNLNPGTTQDDINRIITRGNPNLKPTFASNFDLMAEHYFGGIGMVSVGAFYKKLSNLIYSNQSTQNINGVMFNVNEPDNLQNAWLAGFEAGISKRFVDLPGIWKGFGIDANYTFTDSKAKVPRFDKGKRIEDESVIPKQAKHIFNLSLIFENSKFMARIAGNYKGKYLDAIRQIAGPEHYRWYSSNFSVDFSSSYSINSKFRIFAELNNITGAPVRYYHGVYDRAEQAEWYSVRGQVGISAKLF
ncbi:TonB-dependent receptor [Sphingobacterium sp. DR205]|uniref:TonB-dependent receptor n=1 Tax=Sphingobacterium sp. DR205 TaxID=2713573 RepID=UPI0013E450F0|nr:TonB-dependent receptor [Sphingobacterium sp. DR205]QIH32722.1 TonB-dependent receptor [Sphingobacterium sp. DR205]